MDLFFSRNIDQRFEPGELLVTRDMYDVRVRFRVRARVRDTP